MVIRKDSIVTGVQGTRRARYPEKARLFAAGQRGMQTPFLLPFLVTIPLAVIAFAYLPGILAPALSTLFMFTMLQMNMHPRMAGWGKKWKWHELVVAGVFWGALGILPLLAWLDYQARSRVAEGIVLAMGARDAVAKAYAERGPADMSQRAITGWTPPPAGESVQSISIEKGGTIVVRFTDQVAQAQENQVQIVPLAEGKALDLSDASNRDKKFEWQCGGGAGRTTVPSKLRPSWCR